LFAAATRRVAGAVVDLPLLGGDLVATPAVEAVGQAEDVLLELQAHQLAVAGTLEVVLAIVLKGYRCREAANAHLGAGGKGDGGRGDVCLDGVCGRGGVVVGGGRQQQRSRRKQRGESDEDHGADG
jgi:hypothetical protein